MTVEPVVARQGLVDGGARFLVTGLVVLPLSLGLYLGAVRVGGDPHVARVLSYVVGTALVAVLHRRWTFRTPGVRGALGWTALLYATTFAVVLITHGLALAVLPAVVAAPWITAGAWCVSQGLGTTINFLLLRGVVFR
ncbi:GtrA family protein [Actinomycetospora callitridis]|uniref:GtrA family protein n=1 Tax=Actinomycetospora callitridis TaxID=913944 RepID=UPI0023662351|nr:GtrA family protein [Actinomycetospora callitridis]MDD7921243.1 GtrA family protein [Actinomycetospora callitridis]